MEQLFAEVARRASEDGGEEWLRQCLSAVRAPAEEQQIQPERSVERPRVQEASEERDRSPIARNRGSHGRRRGTTARSRSRDEERSTIPEGGSGDRRQSRRRRGAGSQGALRQSPASCVQAPGESSAAGDGERVMGSAEVRFRSAAPGISQDRASAVSPVVSQAVIPMGAEQVWLRHLAQVSQQASHNLTSANTVINPSVNPCFSVMSPQNTVGQLLQYSPLASSNTLCHTYPINTITSSNFPLSTEGLSYSNFSTSCSATLSQSIASPISSLIPIAQIQSPQSSLQPPNLDRGSSTPEVLLKESYTCAPSPLGYHLPLAVKEKIINGEYVDILSLLPSVKDAVKKLDFKSEEERKRSTPRTLNNWIQGFSIFSAILCEKKPFLSVGLFQHLDAVLEAYRSLGGMSWLYYDEMLRQKMAVFPHMRWGDKDVLLWVSLIQSQRQPPPKNSQFSPNQGSQQIRKGLCFAYNESQCKWLSNCRFKHECAFCGGSHPMARCFKRNNQAQLPNQGLKDSFRKSTDPCEIGKAISMVKSVSRQDDGSPNISGI